MTIWDHVYDYVYEMAPVLTGFFAVLAVVLWGLQEATIDRDTSIITGALLVLISTGVFNAFVHIVNYPRNYFKE